MNKNYKKNNLYYGTIRIEIPKNTDIRYRVSGWIKTVLKNIKPQVGLTQTKWGVLRQVSRPVNLDQNKMRP